MEDELKYFKIEAEEVLENMTKDVLELEKSIDNPDLIKRLFRYAHTLKGSASVVKLPVFSSLFHLVEDMLSGFQNKHPIKPEGITLLLDAISVSGEIVDALKMGQPEKMVDISNIFNCLTTYVNNMSTPTRPSQQFSTSYIKPPKKVLPDTSNASINKSFENQRPFSKNEKTNDQKSIPLTQPEKITNQKSRQTQTDKIPETSLSDDVTMETGEKKNEPVNVRIKSQDLDRLTDLSNELLINYARMKDIMEHIRHSFLNRKNIIETTGNQTLKECEMELEKLENGLERGKLFSKEMSDIIMTARLISIKDRKYYFQKMVRDLSLTTNKPVEFIMKGEELLIDRDLFDRIREPIYHLIRNSIIHGIEIPSERVQQKKNETGSIQLVFEKKGDFLHIQCIDDGCGLDPNKIKNIAKQKNIFTNKVIDEMTDKEALSLIFASGFSTAESISELAGRGVGMDIIKSTITSLGGFLNISSTINQFTCISMTLPGSVNLIDTFMVQVSNHQLLFPLKNVVETRIIDEKDLSYEAGVKVILYQKSPVPLIHLGKLLGLSDNENYLLSKLNVMIVKDNDNIVAFIIDQFGGKKESIVKPLEGALKSIKHLRSSTILENGNPAFVVNVGHIIEQIKGSNHSEISLEIDTSFENSKILLVDDSLTTRTLLCGILETSGYVVKTASSGEEALAMIHEQLYDLILTDVEMSGMSGFELSKKIRKLPEYTEIPIIILTSLSNDSDKRKGIDVGANAYIVKSSFDKKLFLDTVESLI